MKDLYHQPYPYLIGLRYTVDCMGYDSPNLCFCVVCLGPICLKPGARQQGESSSRQPQQSKLEAMGPSMGPQSF